MKLYWSGTTRYHDWRAADRAIPRRMLERARAAGVIGTVEWFSEAPDDRRKEVARDDGVLERLLAKEPRRGSRGFSAGGSQPGLWELGMLLSPYLEADRQVQGYNVLNLWFEDGAFPGVAGSDALARAFRSIHGPENTEAAFTHPHARWMELSDPLSGAYGVPLTLGPMFRGVMWANFLGRGHLALFDVAKLRKLETHQIEWIGKDGLFIRVSADVREATSPDVEKEMLRLTEVMRRALR